MSRAPSIHPSFCRFCHHSCPILVEVEGGRAVRVTGDLGNSVYQGYTCVKGRALPEQHYHRERLLHSQERLPDGTYAPIESARLMDEVAERLRALVDRHGPRSVAFYTGTGLVVAAPINAFVDAFQRAIGTPLRFTSNTIDQPGKAVAKALHGQWMAPPQAFDRPDVALIVGANPLISYQGGLPFGHPAKWLREQLDRGMQLIVIDPRRTDTAKRANLYLQPRPGEDAAIVAGMLRVIMSEDLYDKEFVSENVEGIETLRERVAPFTPEAVARRANVDAADLVAAARIFARADRGYAASGTGPNMSGSGTLFEYLMLSLNTLCGRWLRAGERVPVTATLTPDRPAKAEASPAVAGYGFGEKLRGSGLRDSAAGLPTAGLPDEILDESPDSVRALINVGGNPVAAWPDQRKAIEAMQALDLLIQVDIKMSATAKYADYVVAPTMSFETPSYTLWGDTMGLYSVAQGGNAVPWAQYTEAIVDPPEGSDLVEEWEFFYGVAQRMELQLTVGSVELDMTNKPTSEEILAICATGSRIPLDEVKKHPHGAIFEGTPQYVEPKDPACSHRLDVADAQMMADLDELSRQASDTTNRSALDGECFDFRLISRRIQQAYNSSGRALAGMKRRYNPAFMHPDDLQRLGLCAGASVEIRSRESSIIGIVEPDDTLRPGLVSMTHAFGDVPELDGEYRRYGSCTARLLTVARDLQPYTGQPLMSNIPVSIRRLDERTPKEPAARDDSAVTIQQGGNIT